MWLNKVKQFQKEIFCPAYPICNCFFKNSVKIHDLKGARKKMSNMTMEYGNNL